MVPSRHDLQDVARPAASSARPCASARPATASQASVHAASADGDHYDIELPSIAEKLELINRGRDPHEPPMTIPMPEDRVHILVAGGVAGWHSLMVPTRAFTVPQTVSIV